MTATFMAGLQIGSGPYMKASVTCLGYEGKNAGNVGERTKSLGPSMGRSIDEKF